MPVEKRQCANPNCNCEAPAGGDYCSDYCQEPTRADQIDYDLPLDTGLKQICTCDHEECVAQ